MKEPVRILRVVGKMGRGGAETIIMNAYRLIDKRKLQFDFIVHTEEDHDYHEEIYALGGKIYRMPLYNGINHYSYTSAWENFFNKYTNYNLIHGHLMSTAAVYLQIAKKHGLTTIAHSHNTSFGKGFAAIIKKKLNARIGHIPDYLFACSLPAGQFFFGPDVINKNNFKVIPNGIDVNQYKYNPNTRQEVRRELGIDASPVVGHVGNFDKQKNHNFLISVFKKINDMMPNTVLLLVGDGQFRKQIEDQINEYALHNKVIMTGSRSDVNRLLQAMDVFVFPSYFEGFGNAVTEAQAAGLPCIVSDKVPDEIRITDLVEFLPLHAELTIWADAIIKKLNSLERRDTSEEIFRAGYDIEPIAKWYEHFYLETSLNKNALY